MLLLYTYICCVYHGLTVVVYQYQQKNMHAHFNGPYYMHFFLSLLFSADSRQAAWHDE